jgi:hypothetical protein
MRTTGLKRAFTDDFLHYSKRRFGVLFLRRFVCCGSPVFPCIPLRPRMDDSASLSCTILTISIMPIAGKVMPLELGHLCDKLGPLAAGHPLKLATHQKSTPLVLHRNSSTTCYSAWTNASPCFN